MTMYFDSFCDLGLTPYIPKFWSFWIHQLLGSTRWLAHQIPAPARATGTNAGTKKRRNAETTRSIATPWRTSMKSLKMYGNLMVKSKKTKRNQIQQSKNYRADRSLERSWDKRMDWRWLTPSSHVRPYPPTSDETPVTLSPQSANRQTGGSILKDPNMCLVFQVIFFQMFPNVATSYFKAPDMQCWSKWTPGSVEAAVDGTIRMRFGMPHPLRRSQGSQRDAGLHVFFFLKCLYRQGWRDVIGHSEAICLSSPVEKSTSSLFACDQASSGHVF